MPTIRDLIETSVLEPTDAFVLQRAGSNVGTYYLEAEYLANSAGPPGPQGPQGNTGATGATGPAGVGIESVDIPSGYLNVHYSNSVVANVGYVVGPPGSNGATGPAGSNGATGATGADGVGISGVSIPNGYLTINYSNTVISNVGYVVGPPGATGNTGSTGPIGNAGANGATGPAGANGVGIVSATVPNGWLTFNYSNSTVANVGFVLGPQGPMGNAGANGSTGPAGANGSTGPAGANGIGIVSANITSGYLNFNYSNSTTANVGVVVGAQGPTGANGATGANGVTGSAGANGIGVVSANVTSGYLNFLYSNAATANVGYVAGPQGNTGNAGAQGPTGSTGPTGTSIDGVFISNGYLNVDFDNSTVANIGYVVGPAGSNGTSGSNGANGVGVNSIVLAGNYVNVSYSNGTTANAGPVIGPNIVVSGWSEKTNAVPTSATLTLDLTNTTVFTSSLSANTTVVFTNAANGVSTGFKLKMINNSAGYSVTWPANVKFSGGLAPTLQANSSLTTIFNFWTDNAAVQWYGFPPQSF